MATNLALVKNCDAVATTSLHRSVLAGLVTALLICAFIPIGSEMVEGDTRAFDVATLRAAQSFRVGPTWVAEVMRDLGWLGSTALLTMFTVVAVGCPAVAGARLICVLVAAAVITGTLAVSVLKAPFGRPPPGPDFAELIAPGHELPQRPRGRTSRRTSWPWRR